MSWGVLPKKKKHVKKQNAEKRCLKKTENREATIVDGSEHRLRPARGVAVDGPGGGTGEETESQSAAAAKREHR